MHPRIAAACCRRECAARCPCAFALGAAEILYPCARLPALDRIAWEVASGCVSPFLSTFLRVEIVSRTAYKAFFPATAGRSAAARPPQRTRARHRWLAVASTRAFVCLCLTKARRSFQVRVRGGAVLALLNRNSEILETALLFQSYRIARPMEEYIFFFPFPPRPYARANPRAKHAVVMIQLGPTLFHLSRARRKGRDMF